MPPRRALKDTTVAGRSGHSGEPSGVGQPSGDDRRPRGIDLDLQNVRDALDPRHMPSIGHKKLTVQEFQVFWAAWHWYMVGERHLLPAEVQDIARIYCHQPNLKYKPIALWNQLDNPKFNQKTMDRINDLTEPERQRLIDKVARLFELLIRLPVANSRNKELKGFRGRLSQMPSSKASNRVIDKAPVRPAQLYLLYVIGNWLKDSEDIGISDYEAEEIFNRFYECKVGSSNFYALLKDLRDPTHTLNKPISIIMMEPRHREHFGNLALEMYTEFTTRRGFPAPHLDIPADDEGEREPTTTTSMETSSLTTTAPSSSVPTALGPSENAELGIPWPDDDTAFFDATWYESQSIEASLSPSGSGSNEASGKGKGRARDSSSSSPGDKGKGKGKKPRQ